MKKVAGKDLWLDRLNEEKGLEHVSNGKLLHLEQVFEAVSKEVGSRDKLIGEIAKLQGGRRTTTTRPVWVRNPLQACGIGSKLYNPMLPGNRDRIEAPPRHDAVSAAQ